LFLCNGAVGALKLSALPMPENELFFLVGIIALAIASVAVVSLALFIK